MIDTIESRMMIKKTRKMVGQAIRPSAKSIFQTHKPKCMMNDLESEKLLLLNGSGREDGRSSENNYKIAPRGWLAVYVGPEEKRYMVPMKYLSMPEFENLMERVAEEFGHQHGNGGLRIPNCQVEDFEKMIMALARRTSNKKRSNHL